MSFDHKAYLFDYSGFQRELAPILDAALASDDLAGLTSFIESNLAVLRDPYEGQPLTPGWRQQLESIDAHQLGDFALTKYYRPDADLGISTDWDEVETALADAGLSNALVLGEPFGPAAKPFDPGKMGAYFHSELSARNAVAQLKKLPGADSDPIAALLEVFRRASREGRGVYVTF